MAKFLKYTSAILITFLVMVIVAFGVLVMWVNPNRFKPLIASEFTKYTGRSITIDGDLSWEFFPYLSVKVGHMTLTNPPGFKEKIFAEIDHAALSIKLIPLFSGKIESNGIVFEGVNLNLVKNTKGDVNWVLSNAKDDPVETPTPTNNTKTDDPVDFTIDIPNVDVTKARISLYDEQKNQTTILNQMEFHAKNIHLNQPFPVSSAFNYVTQNTTQKGHVNFDGNVKVDLNKNVFQVDQVYIVIKTQEAKQKSTFAMSGNVIVDNDKETLVVNEFASHLENLLMHGALNINHYKTNPVITGHLQTNVFDLKDFLQATHQDNNTLQVGKNVVADINVNYTPVSGSFINDIVMNGTIKAEQIKTNKIDLNHIKILAQLKNGVLTIPAATANLYDGTLSAQANVKLNQPIPLISLQTKLININIKSLLNEMQNGKSQLKIKGSANVGLNVTSKGLTADTFLRNLNGTAILNVKDGVLEGVNIGYLANVAYAFARHEKTPTQLSQDTEFGMLTATATIQNGVVLNKDLLLDSPSFTTKGQGSINLVTQQINYELQTASKEAGQDTRKNILNIYHLTIPVSITGSLSNPSIHLDTADLLKQIALQQLEKTKGDVNNKLQDVIKDKLPPDASKLLKQFLGS